MVDYEIEKCSRKCSATGRELLNGEVCFSVLLAEEGRVVRRDYAADAWPGPPEDAIGWWQGTIVDPNLGRLSWAPGEVMLRYFEQLLEDPSAAADARYVLALLLVRRRLLRLEATRSEAGQTILTLYEPRSETSYHVAEVLPTPPRAAEIQEKLAELLQTHGV